MYINVDTWGCSWLLAAGLESVPPHHCHHCPQWCQWCSGASAGSVVVAGRPAGDCRWVAHSAQQQRPCIYPNTSTSTAACTSPAHRSCCRVNVVLISSSLAPVKGAWIFKNQILGAYLFYVDIHQTYFFENHLPPDHGHFYRLLNLAI